MSTRFLLLPDLHFGPHSSSMTSVQARGATELSVEGKTEARALEKALRDLSYELPDAVISLGDLTTKADPTGFTIAKSFITELRSLLPQASFFFTPGNHDVVMDESSYPTSFYSKIRSEDAFQRFNEFLESVRAPSSAVSSGAHPHSFVNIVQGNDRRFDVCVMGLNSSRLERPACLGLGYVGLDQAYDVLSEAIRGPLKSYSTGSAKRMPFGLAITHFNPLPANPPGATNIHDSFPNLYRRFQKLSTSFLTDSAQVLGFLLDAGFAVLAHGHSHQKSIVLRVDGYSLAPTLFDREPSPLRVIDAGTFHAAGETSFRQFVWLSFDHYTDETPGYRVSYPEVAKIDIRLCQYDLDGKEVPSGTPLRRTVLPAERLDFTRWTAGEYKNVLSPSAYRAREFAGIYRAWMDFYHAKSNQGNWPQKLNEIQKDVERHPTRKAQPLTASERQELQRICNDLDPTQAPSPHDLESPPSVCVFEKLFPRKEQ